MMAGMIPIMTGGQIESLEKIRLFLSYSSHISLNTIIIQLITFGASCFSSSQLVIQKAVDIIRFSPITIG